MGGGSVITADGDCSHEIKRCLLLGRKAMTKLQSWGLANLFQKTLPWSVSSKISNRSYSLNSRPTTYSGFACKSGLNTIWITKTTGLNLAHLISTFSKTSPTSSNRMVSAWRSVTPKLFGLFEGDLPYAKAAPLTRFSCILPPKQKDPSSIPSS